MRGARHLDSFGVVHPAMPELQKAEFPGGSKSRVNRAGENVRVGQPTPEDFHVIEEWRAAHRAALTPFKQSSPTN